MVRVIKKTEERKREIILAAKELFADKEFAKITMQDLIEKVGIAKGTLYHHFTCKQEILEAVVQDIVDEELVRKRNLLNANRKLSALKKMRLLVTSSNATTIYAKILKGLHHPDNSTIHTRHFACLLSSLAPLYAAVITQGCQEGIFQTDYPLECAEFLLAGVQFITDVGFYPWSKKVLTRRERSFPSLIEALLKAPKGSFRFLNEE